MSSMKLTLGSFIWPQSDCRIITVYIVCIATIVAIVIIDHFTILTSKLNRPHQDL